jgi:hypothetical protein
MSLTVKADVIENRQYFKLSWDVAKEEMKIRLLQNLLD